MLAAVKLKMLADFQATAPAPAAAPTAPMPSGPDGGPLSWDAYQAHYANLEQEQDYLTPKSTLATQWDKYKVAFAAKVAKGTFV